MPFKKKIWISLFFLTAFFPLELKLCTLLVVYRHSYIHPQPSSMPDRPECHYLILLQSSESELSMNMITSMQSSFMQNRPECHQLILLRSSESDISMASLQKLDKITYESISRYSWKLAPRMKELAPSMAGVIVNQRNIKRNKSMFMRI